MSSFHPLVSRVGNLVDILLLSKATLSFKTYNSTQDHDQTVLALHVGLNISLYDTEEMILTLLPTRKAKDNTSCTSQKVFPNLTM